MTATYTPLVIREVRVHPLRVRLPKAQKTSQALWEALEIVVVEVETSDGIVGIGEALARNGAAGYARSISDALVPRLIGQDAQDRRRLWKLMRSTLTGRPGGQ